MEITTKYITPDDFKTYFGIDLDASLRDDANPSNKAIAFLKRVEDRLATFLDANFYRKVDSEYPNFTNYQKEHYQRALLEQAIYVFKNGDISVDSGYEPDRGEIVARETLTKLSIAENAKQELLLCGLWCRKVNPKNRNGYDKWCY